MKGGGDQEQGAAGGPARHVPVLREEVLRALDLPRAEPGLYLDATFGAGGYAAATPLPTRNEAAGARPRSTAIAGGAALVDKFGDRLTLVEARFADLDNVAGAGKPRPLRRDRARYRRVLDADRRGRAWLLVPPGWPSRHADGRRRPHRRGHRQHERRKRRWPTSSTITARSGCRVASPRAIVLDRETKQPFLTTRPLAEMIARIVPHKPTDIHPATRTFQALRIAVNDELGELVAGLAAAERVLAPGGRLAVVNLPFARGPHRQAVLRPALRQGRGPRGAGCPASPRRSRRASRCRGDSRSRPAPRRTRAIRARARPSCASASAPISPRCRSNHRSSISPPCRSARRNPANRNLEDHDDPHPQLHRHRGADRVGDLRLFDQVPHDVPRRGRSRASSPRSRRSRTRSACCGRNGRIWCGPSGCRRSPTSCSICSRWRSARSSRSTRSPTRPAATSTRSAASSPNIGLAEPTSTPEDTSDTPSSPRDTQPSPMKARR